MPAPHLFRPNSPPAPRRLLVLALAQTFAAMGAAAWVGSVQAQEEQRQQARVIVRFKPAAQSVRAKPLALRARAAEALDVAQARATGLGLRNGRTLQARLSLDERTHVLTARGLSSAALARQLAADAEVELAVVDQRRRHSAVPNDPYYAVGPANSPAVGQWYLKAPTAELVSSINAPAAWDGGTGSAGIVVAVLDTGIRKDHPDLAGQIVGGYDMVGYSDSVGAVATANDGDRDDADASDPGDWVTQADVNNSVLGCTSDDIGASSWHGTRVAGLIAAASNNGRGMAGVAGGSKILPVRVLGKCGGYDSDIMAGMRWAAGLAVPGVPSNPNPARVLNLSLGGDGSCNGGGSAQLYREAIAAITALGSSIVVASGNSAGLAVGLPGNCSGVIAVSGLRHVGTKVGFSSLGPEVALAAPGGNCGQDWVDGIGPCLWPMFSTTNSGTQGPVLNEEAYTNGSASVGTSFATPLVAGVVALMLQRQPALTPSQIRDLLRSTVRPFVGSGGTADTELCRAPNAAEQLECYCTTSTCGAGMLDAAAAVAAAAATPAPAPAPPPPAPAPAPVDSGGGGALGGLWLLGLGLAGAALRRPSRPAPRPRD